MSKAPVVRRSKYECAINRLNDLPNDLDVIMSDAFEELQTARKEALDRLEKQTDWYQQRFNRLRRWVEEEVRPLNEGIAIRYYSICANGSPAPHESADWSNTLHDLSLRLEQAKLQINKIKLERDKLYSELEDAKKRLAAYDADAVSEKLRVAPTALLDIAVPKP